ncbi:hypothetical protein RE428_01120 [Marinobacter nanhaiticus D15-8W]|uniref:Uncharacterized protein n=1 Tax=Marinobacter nanhaiticus D15-8W TaxID=626887 RepID=N6W4X1_9GAMM|nr:hypothetical protein [Marinobacter nanhaiticus]ENO15204.1 hypothetical protein J057_07636 [Marinobacter nanhaiticus D15-8W]BES69094.1 hypothetical protein RE428_01120 [Marinobacter nanhaiticus D15-8W]
MADKSDWKTDRERYEAAWTKYQEVADRVYAAYEDLDSGAQDQAPANEDLSELQEAWKELENARERLNESANELHERHMAQGKSISN